MKLLLSISLIFSFVISADDHDAPEYKYEPDVARLNILLALITKEKI